MDETTLVEIQPDGAILLPATLREELGMLPGGAVLLERTGGGVLLRAVDPAATNAGTTGDAEQTAEERQAAALLADAVSEDEYARAVAEVRGMGLDPADVTRTAAGE